MNILKQFIDYQVSISEKHAPSRYIFGEEMFFKEFRLFYFVGARQSGTTTFISEIFNPKTDIYVGPNSGCVDDFVKNKLLNPMHTVCTNTFKNYDQYWNKVRGVIGSSEVNKIYLDIGVGKVDTSNGRFESILGDIRESFPNAYVIVT